MATLLSLLALLATFQIPSDAKSLFGPVYLASPTGVATSRTVPVQGKPFKDALEVRVLKACPNPWEVQVQTDGSLVPIVKGRTYYFHYWARALDGKPAGWSFYVQRAAEPWTGLSGGQGGARGAWREFHHAFVADRDFPAGEVNLTMHAGQMAQAFQIGGFRALDLGVYDLAKVPANRLEWEGSEPTAAWRKEAAKRIEQHRKGDLTVDVVDRRGKPVRNQSVRVKMLRHAYDFGSFVESPLLADSADGRRYRDWFAKAYDKATVPMYWADFGWESKEEFARYMKYPVWMREHGIRLKAHCLIYPGWQFLPSRMGKLEGDPKAFWAEMDKHLAEGAEVTRRFGIDAWDVLNELRDLKDLVKIFGSERVYGDLFKRMKALAPKPTLYLNENSILTGCGDTEPQQAEYERILRALKAQGAPVEGIGMQGHFGENVTPPTRIWQIADRFAKFGVPLQITEFDLPTRDEIGQAAYTRDLLTAWFAHPATTGFIMWGFWEGSMWTPSGALIAKDWRVKPNGKMWLELVRKRWWTDVTVRTDAKGRAKVRGFKGNYEVTTQARGETSGATVTLKADQRVRLVL